MITDKMLKSEAGDKVRFVNPNAGHQADIDFAERSGLVVGEAYTLSDICVHNYHTDIYLVGISGCFNSVQFEAV